MIRMMLLRLETTALQRGWRELTVVVDSGWNSGLHVEISGSLQLLSQTGQIPLIYRVPEHERLWFRTMQSHSTLQTEGLAYCNRCSVNSLSCTYLHIPPALSA
jgi:hypothetical protein